MHSYCREVKFIYFLGLKNRFYWFTAQVRLQSSVKNKGLIVITTIIIILNLLHEYWVPVTMLSAV